MLKLITTYLTNVCQSRAISAKKEFDSGVMGYYRCGRTEDPNGSLITHEIILTNDGDVCGMHRSLFTGNLLSQGK